MSFIKASRGGLHICNFSMTFLIPNVKLKKIFLDQLAFYKKRVQTQRKVYKYNYCERLKELFQRVQKI